MGLTRLQTAVNVRENLNDLGVTWYSTDNINDSLQDGYDLLSALLNPIQQTTFFPQRARPYYPLTDSIPDLYSTMGIYNPDTNLWLDYTPLTELSKERWDWERWNGAPCFWSPLSFRYTVIVPWNPANPQPGSALYLAYIAKAPTMTDNTIPNIPQATKSTLEYWATCELLEQVREFKKAQSWLDKFKESLSESKLIVKDLARIHRLKVMEPWNPLGRYAGVGYQMTIINDELPTGTIDGVNATFTIAAIPNPTSSLALYKNGILMIQGIAYTLNGNVITINSGYIPQPAPSGGVADTLKAWYQQA